MSSTPPDAIPPQLESRRSTFRAQARSDRHRVVAMGVAITLLVAALAFWLLDWRRARLDREALLELAQPATTNLIQRLRSNFEVLRATGAFVSATHDALTPDRFRDFTQPLLARHPAVYALEWAPRVEEAERAAFEAAMRAEGRPNFAIREPIGAQGLKAALAREVYFPIVHEEPDGAAIGLDVTFEDERRATVREALSTGEIVTSPPFELAERDDREKYVAIYMPVAAPEGVAILVLKTSSVLETWSREIPDPALELWVQGGNEGQLSFGNPDVVNAEEHWVTNVPFGRGEIRLAYGVPWGFGGGGQLAVVGTVAVFLLGLLITGLLWGADRVRSLRAEIDKAKELGQYVVERKLGQGAMGVVFLARHALMKRPTALKLMLSQEERSIARFEREVMLSCQLSHPNIVAIYDFGRTEDGIFYYAMEYLPGVDLHSLVGEEGPIGDGRAISFLVQLARGLREAHAAGLVHRDIKPGNLVITRAGTQCDVLKILDFGLVKTVVDPEAPDAGRIVGTPLYMAPESIRTPDEAGPAADVYALGCVAFHLLTGHAPFVGAHVRSILRMHLESPPPSLADISARRISPELEQLVNDCLAKSPDDRPPDDELLHRLQRLPVVAPWSEWDAADWWARREVATSEPSGDTTSLREVTVLARRPVER
jgi:serine/threonine-protein kinase